MYTPQKWQEIPAFPDLQSYRVKSNNSGQVVSTIHFFDKGL